MAQLLGHGEIEGVEAGSLQTIVQVKEESADSLITQIFCSGTIFAEYSVFVRGSKGPTKRSGPSRNVNFDFIEPVSLGRTNSLEVKVIHYKMDETGKFECSIFAIRD